MLKTHQDRESENHRGLAAVTRQRRFCRAGEDAIGNAKRVSVTLVKTPSATPNAFLSRREVPSGNAKGVSVALTKPPLETPKAFRPPAQGCRVATTLGKLPSIPK